MQYINFSQVLSFFAEFHHPLYTLETIKFDECEFEWTNPSQLFEFLRFIIPVSLQNYHITMSILTYWETRWNDNDIAQLSENQIDMLKTKQDSVILECVQMFHEDRKRNCENLSYSKDDPNNTTITYSNIKYLSFVDCRDTTDHAIATKESPVVDNQLKQLQSDGDRIKNGLCNLRALCWKLSQSDDDSDDDISKRDVDYLVFPQIWYEILNNIGNRLESLHFVDTMAGNSGWIFFQQYSSKFKTNGTDSISTSIDTTEKDNINHMNQPWYPINVKEICIHDGIHSALNKNGHLRQKYNYFWCDIASWNLPKLQRLNVATPLDDENIKYIVKGSMKNDMSSLINNGLNCLCINLKCCLDDCGKKTKSHNIKSYIKSFCTMIDNCDANKCIDRNFIFKVTFNVELRMNEMGEFEYMIATRLFEFNFSGIINLFKSINNKFKNCMIGVKFHITQIIYGPNPNVDWEIANMEDASESLKTKALPYLVAACVQTDEIQFDCDITTKKQDSELVFTIILKNTNSDNDICYMEPYFDFPCKRCQPHPYLT